MKQGEDPQSPAVTNTGVPRCYIISEEDFKELQMYQLHETAVLTFTFTTMVFNPARQEEAVSVGLEGAL